MTTYERWLLDALQKMSAAWGPVKPGYYYRSPVDFVIREGVWIRPRAAPEYDKGAPKACFGNAIHHAVRYGLRYMEGWAFTPELMPVHHAWNLTDAGDLVDCTWGAFQHGKQIKQVGVAYLGVEFSAGRADDATWNGDATVLDDCNRGWPILREKWHGEDPSIEWEPSALMLALFSARDGHLDEAEQLLRQVEA